MSGAWGSWCGSVLARRARPTHPYTAAHCGRHGGLTAHVSLHHPLHLRKHLRKRPPARQDYENPYMTRVVIFTRVSAGRNLSFQGFRPCRNPSKYDKPCHIRGFVGFIFRKHQACRARQVNSSTLTYQAPRKPLEY